LTEIKLILYEASHWFFQKLKIMISSTRNWGFAHW